MAFASWASWGEGLGAGTSHAAAFQVEARTEAQAYQIRAWRGSTPESPVLLPRRRIVQYLGLNAFELATGEDMGFESNLRIWADFGLPRGEAALVDGCCWRIWAASTRRRGIARR
ncbi:hypothetical protein BHS09_16100 [Myxococcus xanthus]|uniref:Uncharacterized protein n=1 Tax=Myxococcus xanthus TaxID=34 RepID=A0AAE6KSK3_MYXXA|nr:hypothetical protein [Myxococcus xanthus]QDE68378.1 hypothetical protein BHS09_16100 [Myxococcus xanthus]QDE75655.1 hypothetical protein BHS08_16115 [Myxococcus xanthus]QDF04790.1 hypothetical protein BHS04_16505 [Myxococcus xanthus]